jgi:hypothetical protein
VNTFGLCSHKGQTQIQCLQQALIGKKERRKEGRKRNNISAVHKKTFFINLWLLHPTLCTDSYMVEMASTWSRNNKKKGKETMDQHPNF